MFFYYYYLLLTGCWSFAQLPPPEFSFIPPPPHAVIRGWGSACSSTQCLSAHSSPWELQISAWGGHRAAAHLLQCCGCRGSPGSWEGCVLLGCHAGVMGGSNGDP